MNGSVDVLEVMADAALFLNGTRYADTGVELTEARAVVADLIEAARLTQELLAFGGDVCLTLDAALARIGGDA